MSTSSKHSRFLSFTLLATPDKPSQNKTKEGVEQKNTIFSLPLCVGRDRSSSCLVLTFSLRSKNSTAVPLAQHGPTFGVAGTVLFLHIYAQLHIDRRFSPRTSDFYLTSPSRCWLIVLVKGVWSCYTLTAPFKYQTESYDITQPSETPVSVRCVIHVVHSPCYLTFFGG